MKKSKKSTKAAAKKQPVKPTKPIVKPVEGVEKRNFVLLSWSGESIGTYTGRAPRQAALKAANKGVTDIIFKEAGRRKVKVSKKNGKVVYMKIHRFAGATKTRPKTASDPEWMVDPVSVPVVEKIGVYWVPMKFEGDIVDHMGGQT